MSDVDLIERIERRLASYRYGLRLNSPKEEMMLADIVALLPLARDGIRFRDAVAEMKDEPKLTLDDTKESQV